MILFIVLQIRLLKSRNKILFIFLVCWFTASADAQTADSLRLDYNYFNSVPQNAQIYLNDEFIGNTPLFFNWGDSVFPKQVKITLNGYTDIVENVDNTARISKLYTMIPLKGTRKSDQVSEDKQLYFENPRKLFPVVISSLFTLGAGASAYYFKSLAIDNRDEYNITGDPAALDRKKKYDLLSGISIVVFQAGLGALIYFLLID